MKLVDLAAHQESRKKGGGGGGDELDPYRQWQARQVLALLPENVDEGERILKWAMAMLALFKGATRPF